VPNKNHVELMGHLGRDPETKFLPSGQQLTKFSLCTNYNVKRGDEWVSTPDWHNIVCWGKQAEIAAEQFRKGDAIYVEGRLTYRSWEGKDGNKRTAAEIIASFCWLLAPAPKEKKPNTRQEPESQPRRKQEDYTPPTEEDIPF